MKNKGQKKTVPPKAPSVPRPASKPTAPSPPASPKAQAAPAKPQAAPPKPAPAPPKPQAAPAKPAPGPPKSPPAIAARPPLPKPEVAVLDSDALASVPPAPAARPAPPAKPEVAILDSDALASVPPIPAAAPTPFASPFAPVPPPAGPPPATTARDDSRPNARSHKRLPFEIELTIVSDHNFYAGLTLNISEGGLFVGTHVEYPVGTRLEIRLLFPGDEEPTALMTEVRWVRPLHAAGNSSPGMGLRFVDLSPDVSDKISRFARQRQPLYYEDD